MFGISVFRIVKRGGQIAFAGENDANGKTEEVVDRAHPAGVATGEVIVDGDEVNAAAGKSIENNGGNGGKSLAFSRFLFGNLALVESQAGQQLDVERTHLQSPDERLAGKGKNFGQDIVEVCPVDEVVFELLDLDGKVLVLEFFSPGLVIVDLFDQNEQFFDFFDVRIKKLI